MSTNEKRAQQLAEGFREQHGLGDAPIKDLFALPHATLGIDVLSVSVPETEHGLSMLDPSTGRIVIAVATTPHPMRQRSSIAHELGHVLAGDLDRPESLTPGERSPEEICADAFARHVLLPLAAIQRRLTGAVGLPELSALVQEFGVSPHIAAIQLRTLTLIDADTSTAWSSRTAANLATTFGWGSQYRSLAADSTLPRAPQSLMARAVEGYKRGHLGIKELASWYGQDPADLAEELGPPRSPDDPDDWDGWDDNRPLFPADAALLEEEARFPGEGVRATAEEGPGEVSR